TLKKLEPGYAVSFSDGKKFEMTTDIQKLRMQADSFTENGSKLFDKYHEDVRVKFESSRSTFIERDFASLWEMIGWNEMSAAMKIKPLGNAYQHLYRIFKDPHLATALSCQALYLGQAPQKTPALYNLLAYSEFTYGIWYPMGGMRQIPLALEKVFKEMGGEIQLNAPVKKITVEAGRASGVILENGVQYHSDAVVSNRDLPASYTNFIEEQERPKVTNQKINRWNYGCSTFMIYLGLSKRLKNILHHNLLVTKDFGRPIDQIFNQGTLPDEPLLYVCCPTKTDPSLAPEGHEALYILCIVPNLNGKVDWTKDRAEFRKRVFKRIHQAGIEFEESDIQMEEQFSPEDFRDLYGTHLGTAFGLAPDFLQSAAFRPSIKSKDIRGLYHVGMSTHPGGGIPMVLTCGKLCAHRIRQDFSEMAVS
ncbi:MAG: phytoene desaturase, partial [Candidatus Omnitrophica bacterium]|nr:phytoene desaturase [Candidatus Omnitrophota bacterium]